MKTLRSNIWLLIAAFFTIWAGGVSYASEAPRQVLLSDQEMSTLKGQAAIYGYVYYYGVGRSGAWVNARQISWPYGYKYATSSSGGYYYINLGGSIYEWWNNPTGWWRTWATYNGTSSNCTNVYIQSIYSTARADHYIPGNYGCY